MPAGYSVPMKLITGLFAIAVAVGIAAPAQARPDFVQDKGVTYVANLVGVPRVTSLITSTGATVWITELDDFVPPDLSTLSLALDKNVLYVTAASDSAPNLGFTWALDANTGAILWLSTTPGGGLYSAATVSKGVVYVAGAATTGPSKATALDIVTGGIIWQSANLPFPSGSSPVADRDAVVLTVGGFTQFPYYLVILDAATGQIVRSSPAP